MTTTLDHGIRCDRHVGEAFRVRCADCDAEAAAALAVEQLEHPQRYQPNSNCRLHDGYPLPCDRCARDRSNS